MDARETVVGVGTLRPWEGGCHGAVEWTAKSRFQDRYTKELTFVNSDYNAYSALNLTCLGPHI